MCLPDICDIQDLLKIVCPSPSHLYAIAQYLATNTNKEHTLFVACGMELHSSEDYRISTMDDYRISRMDDYRISRMDDYRISRRVLMAEVSGGRVRGRPRLGGMDGVKVALGNRGMTV